MINQNYKEEMKLRQFKIWNLKYNLLTESIILTIWTQEDYNRSNNHELWTENLNLNMLYNNQHVATKMCTQLQTKMIKF